MTWAVTDFGPREFFLGGGVENKIGYGYGGMNIPELIELYTLYR